MQCRTVIVVRLCTVVAPSSGYLLSMAATEMGRTSAGSIAPHLTVAERVARGKAARGEVPRSSHAVFEPASHRVDPIELLERQAETRVAELVPIRYGRMLLSPFTFYRGAAMIMASDLVATPRSGLNVQCCGDAHLSNFGVFASPERRLVFDLNDFDETLPGPWEWDVKRLAASVLIAARENGFVVKDQDQAVLGTVEAYRTTMASFAAMRNLDVWYARLDIEGVLANLGPQLTPRMVKRTEKNLAKARTRDNMSAFSKLTRVVDGEARIVAEPPLIVPSTTSYRAASTMRCSTGCAGCCGPIAKRSCMIGVCCSSSSAWSTSRVRLSGWGVSVRAPGSR